jgi:hypothetical protein
MKTDGDAASSKRELDALTAAFFRAVTFAEGETPAYANLPHLFLPSACLIRNSGAAPEVSTLSQFIEARQRKVAAGELTHFREAETREITEIFGQVAHRFSTYEKEGLDLGVALAGRGIISIQFVMTPAGWKISSMVWDDERPGLTIPQRYR